MSIISKNLFEQVIDDKTAGGEWALKAIDGIKSVLFGSRGHTFRKGMKMFNATEAGAGLLKAKQEAGNALRTAVKNGIDKGSQEYATLLEKSKAAGAAYGKASKQYVEGNAENIMTNTFKKRALGATIGVGGTGYAIHKATEEPEHWYDRFTKNSSANTLPLYFQNTFAGQDLFDFDKIARKKHKLKDTYRYISQQPQDVQEAYYAAESARRDTELAARSHGLGIQHEMERNAIDKAQKEWEQWRARGAKNTRNVKSGKKAVSSTLNKVAPAVPQVVPTEVALSTVPVKVVPNAVSAASVPVVPTEILLNTAQVNAIPNKATASGLPATQVEAAMNQTQTGSRISNVKSRIKDVYKKIIATAKAHPYAVAASLLGTTALGAGGYYLYNKDNDNWYDRFTKSGNLNDIPLYLQDKIASGTGFDLLAMVDKTAGDGGDSVFIGGWKSKDGSRKNPSALGIVSSGLLAGAADDLYTQRRAKGRGAVRSALGYLNAPMGALGGSIAGAALAPVTFGLSVPIGAAAGAAGQIAMAGNESPYVHVLPTLGGASIGAVLGAGIGGSVNTSPTRSFNDTGAVIGGLAGAGLGGLSGYALSRLMN